VVWPCRIRTAPLSWQALGAELGNRRDRLDRGRRFHRRGQVPGARLLPKFRARACLLWQICLWSASRGWLSTASLPKRTPSFGAAYKSSTSTPAPVYIFRIDGPVGELYDLGVVPGVVRPMALGFASSEILGLIPTTHFERLGRLRADVPNRASCQRPFRLSP